MNLKIDILCILEGVLYFRVSSNFQNYQNNKLVFPSTIKVFKELFHKMTICLTHGNKMLSFNIFLTNDN